MKLNKFKILLPLMASLTCLTGCDFDLSDIIQISTEKKEEEIKDDADSLKSGYYKDINFNSSRILTQLQELCFTKHKVYIQYSQVNSYYSNTSDRKSAENVPGTSYNQYFYTGKEASGYGTREHVWPCANSASLWVHDGTEDHVHNVDKSNYVGGGSDLYHIRTANSTINTARGNGKFVDFDDAEFESIRSGVAEVSENKGKYNLKIQGYQTTAAGVKQYSQKCEVDDHMKGDVARIVLYVWTHYGDRGVAPSGSYKSGNKSFPYEEMCGSLSFTNILGYDTMERCAEKLVEWNEMDPPSEVEKQRNNTVQKIQGNRNPYVDFPELARSVLDEFLE